MKTEEEEMQLALKAKEEVVRLDKDRREREQEQKRALFADQRHTETITRTKEALRERLEKIQRRKERVLKERQAREEKRLLNQIETEAAKREQHEREAVQELMVSKVTRITNQKARYQDDAIDWSSRDISEIPDVLYKGRDAINTLTSLLLLNLSGNKLKKLPHTMFSYLFSLQVLDLSDNCIDKLPREVGEARDLEVLDLRNNQLVALPVELKHLRNLEYLNVSHNLLEVFGEVVVEGENYASRKESYCTGLNALLELNLSSNPSLRLISESISALTSLNLLHLRGCFSLKKLPDGLSGLPSLMALDFSCSQVRRIGKHVFGTQLVALRRLNLSSNYLSTCPEALAGAKELQELDLTDNEMTTLPIAVPLLRELVVLRASKNKIESLPPAIGNLESLEELYLASNRLSALPPTFGLMTALYRLDLRSNRLNEIPMEMGALVNLRHLDLSWNQLARLPDEIGCAVALKCVDLSHNLMCSLPDTIVLWENVELINCSHNRLQTPLTPSLQHLTKLTYVDFSSNKITQLEPTLFNLPNVEVLNLANNQISSLPKELAESPCASSLQKLDLHHNRLTAIPLEWADLLNRLEVFSIGKNPMTLLPEKWSDQWRLVDQFTAGMSNGYTQTQLKEWTLDWSAWYPVVVMAWKQGSHTTSDSFVADVRARLGEEAWHQRLERMVRFYYFEFKHRGHEVVFAEMTQSERTDHQATEDALRQQNESRMDAAVAIHEAQRERLRLRYAVDKDATKERATELRRDHERRMLNDVRAETLQWNDVVQQRLPLANDRHEAFVGARRKAFADEMKALARQREQNKRVGQRGRSVARVAISLSVDERSSE
ncbi:hypothetical protein PINS_up013352 [Pythium insidiosum]|nr:hypothetical protein PINS_up013352 [Pythium insidiosum]